MPPDTIPGAFDVLKASFIDTLAANAADAFVAGEVRAVKQLGIGLNLSLINSRAVEATKQYRETLVRFGGSDVVEVINGRPTVVFKPWLKDAVESDLNEIGKIINNGVMNGTPLKQVEQALDEVFAMRKKNAALTAFQETKALYQKGTMDRFRDEGIGRAEFVHMDPQTAPREEHQALDGQVFDLDDPVWNLLNEPNCHCYARPIIVGRSVKE
ncbi:MAG: phage minor head protein [Dehalococcoidia bacterium]